MSTAEVWILHRDRVILVQLTGYGVPEAVVVSSDGTVGGTLYDASAYFGPFRLPDIGWGSAAVKARELANKFNYAVKYFDPEAYDESAGDGDDDI